MRLSLNTFARAMIFTGGIILSLPGQAELIAVEKAAEANRVTLHFSSGSEDRGMVQVNECDECPLSLTVDAKTHFFRNGKEIRRNKAESLSGTPATVIYSQDGKRALRINW